jgi:glucosamine--fructose-6-phosphate aminotransferase (isomerizing)
MAKGPGVPERGQGMTTDIAEQPEVYARLLEPARLAEIAAVAARVVARGPRHVVFTARGTSDHAALYGAYLTEIRLGRPAGLASPSSVTVYGARPDLSDALVIGVSQSGGSADLVEVMHSARATGALTVAVTNNSASELARAAELHIDVAAGHERAVAATKTYTAELLALLLLVESIRGGGALPEDERAAIGELPQLARGLLDDSAPADIAGRYRFAARVVTTGRGYAYPTAREAALKLMETSYLPALAFSGADLLHGPLAMTAPDVPVLAVIGDGPAGRAMRDVVTRLDERRADVVAIGPSAIEGVRLRIATPRVDERYAPMLDILPLQRLALTIALGRGEDPDTPRGLNKVTTTR